MDVQVELDQKVMTGRELLEMRPGSVIRLTRSAGENIDLFIGGKLFGLGEIVIIENRLNVRITDLL